MTDNQRPEDGAADSSAEASPMIPFNYEAWRADRTARGRDLLKQAEHGWSAMTGWDQLETQADWEQLKADAVEGWESGETLLQMRGGARYLQPERAALLLTLWRDFLVQYRPEGPAELMVVAMAVLSFDHFLRVNTLVHNLEARLETEFFSLEPLHTRSDQDKTRFMPGGLIAEQFGDQFRMQALPLLDRLNRLVIRNLRALRELKGASLSVRVENYGQLNLGQTQTNTAPSPTRGRRSAAMPQSKKRGTRSGANNGR